MRMHLLSKPMLACLLLTGMVTRAQHTEILLWPNGAPGSEGKTGNEKLRIVEGDHVLSNIHHPSITLYLPAKEKAKLEDPLKNSDGIWIISLKISKADASVFLY